MMAESEVIECPPTPEHLPVPDSPNLIRELLDTSSSDVEDIVTDGRSSPPPKCAICLGKCRNKCFTDSCLHQFCYKCLLEWSKIKAECPLCKQIFRSIIHNVQSIDQFEEHLVRPSPHPSQSSSQYQHSIPHGQSNSQSVFHRLDFLLSEPPRFTYRPQQSEAIQQLFLHRSPLTERYSREYADDLIPYRQHGTEWRRYIYDRFLYALPLADITGRMRECSAAFYRENPAQIHRIMPWVNRELVALFRGNRYQIDMTMNFFPELLTQHDISSEEFRQHCHYWGQQRTDHFIHELLNYCRSPYDMIGYDRSVRYTPYYALNQESQVIISSSSDSTDTEDVIRVTNPRRGRTQFTIETRSSRSTVIVTGSFGGVEGGEAVNNISTSTTTPGYLPQVQGNICQHTRLPSLTALNPVQCTRNISLTSSSDSDEIQFVREQKPPHLRTPELVSLNSESDSDVVFVDDNNQPNGNKSKNVPPAGVFEVSIFSDDSTSNSNVKNANSCKTEDTKEFNIPSTSSAFSPLPSSSKSSSSSTMTNASLLSVKNVNIVDCNNGASTSGGCTSMEPEFQPMKFYAIPKLNLHALKKSGFISSETESSHDEVTFNIKSMDNSFRNRKRKYTPRKCDDSDNDSDRSERKKPKKTKSKSKQKVNSDKRHKTPKRDIKKKSTTTTSTSKRTKTKSLNVKKETRSVDESSNSHCCSTPKVKKVVFRRYRPSDDDDSDSTSSDTSDEDNTSESEFYIKNKDVIDNIDSDSSSSSTSSGMSDTSESSSFRFKHYV